MTTFTITNAYVGTKTGATVQPPPIGEWWPLTVEFIVTGTPKNPYHIEAGIAEQSTYVMFTDLTPGAKTATGWLFVPLDGQIPWTVDVDPFNLADADDPTKSKIPLNLPDGIGAASTMRVVSTTPVVGLASKKSLHGTFQPAPPSSAIEFYDPVWAIATQSVFMKFKPGGAITRIEALLGCPSTDSWQKALSTVCRAGAGPATDLIAHRPVENPTEQPVYFWRKQNVPVQDVSIIHQSTLELKNCRVDASVLRTVTWQQLDALAGIDVFEFYRSPEAVVESKHAKIAAFVAQTLGANHRQHHTPYDAARKLFQAVLAHTEYYYPAKGAADLRPATSVGVLDAGFGDCGGFSILLVAAYRNIGFAARVACGAWIGQDAGHCWCELYFPQHGWMISDGSAGNSMSESGAYAYYFGTIPNLNQRYACMRGNTFNVADITTSWLQGPYGPVVQGSATIASADSHTGVVQVTQAEAESLAEAQTANTARDLHVTQLPHATIAPVARARRDAVTACPCHMHGGFTRHAHARVEASLPAAGKALGSADVTAKVTGH